MLVKFSAVRLKFRQCGYKFTSGSTSAPKLKYKLWALNHIVWSLKFTMFYTFLMLARVVSEKILQCMYSTNITITAILNFFFFVLLCRNLKNWGKRASKTGWTFLTIQRLFSKQDSSYMYILYRTSYINKNLCLFS